jgi:hypothetical protein
MNEKNPIAILAVKLQQVSSQKNQNSPIELFSAGKISPILILIYNRFHIKLHILIKAIIGETNK